MERWKLDLPFPDTPVWYLDTVTSTMERAYEAVRARSGSSAVICAAFQQAGRGRIAGRSWVSEPGDSLMFTYAFPRSAWARPVQLLPILTGLGVAVYLRQRFSLTPAIKWPNDILVKQRKLCGILCEARGSYLLVGVGLNCRQSSFPPFARTGTFPPISLSMASELPIPDDRELLGGLLKALHDSYTSSGWQGQVNSLLYGRGTRVAFDPCPAKETTAPPAEVGCADGFIRGTLIGIDSDGALCLDDCDGRRSVWYAGELIFEDHAVQEQKPEW